jgi:mannitol/fructose-specific phosphotransferase system IIA component (Ntr-type)
MEIVFGLLALQAGLIGETAFVALVVMALATTMMSGPALRVLLRLKEPRVWVELAGSQSFVPLLAAQNRREAIAELAATLRWRSGVPAERVLELVWERERLTPTGLGRGVAVPHARVDGLREPAIAIGLSAAGIDFDSVDGAPAHVIVLLLTPGGADAAHLELLAQIGRSLVDERLRARLQEARTFTEVLAILRTEGAERGG